LQHVERRAETAASRWSRASIAAIAVLNKPIAFARRAADIVIRRYMEEGAKIARDITARYGN